MSKENGKTIDQVVGKGVEKVVKERIGATITDQEKNLFATIADAALKTGGWNMLEAVNYWKNKIDSLTK